MECKENEKNLYHFTNIDSLMRIVLTNQFLFNSIKNMNDINESMSFFENEYNKENFDVYVEEHVKNKLNDRFDEEIRLKTIFEDKDINEAKEEVIVEWFKGKKFIAEKIIEKMIDNFMEKIKICCFNEMGSETILEKHLLWGHYARSNTGMAIRFNKEKLISIFESQIDDKQLLWYGNINYRDNTFIRKMNKTVSNHIIDFNTNRNKLANLQYYIDNYERIYSYSYYDDDEYNDYYDNEKEICISKWEEELKSIRALNRELISEIIKDKYLIKSEGWKYENEYRFIIYDHNSKDGIIFLEGVNDAIEEIIIGAKANDIDVKIVKELNKKIFNSKLKISKYSELLEDKLLKDIYVYK